MTSPQTTPKRALILGATGAIGQASAHALAARYSQGAQTLELTLTYHEREGQATTLASELGARALRCDLSQASSRDALIAALIDSPPQLIIHCAGTSPPEASLDSLTDERWAYVMGVNCAGFVQIIRGLRAAISAQGGADVICLGALDRAQSLPLPVAFAASQGAINATCMALAHELAPEGWRINVLVSGLLERGLGASLATETREAYTRYSALQRPGHPDEIARAVVWLATDNAYINGKIVPINGGI